MAIKRTYANDSTKENYIKISYVSYNPSGVVIFYAQAFERDLTPIDPAPDKALGEAQSFTLTEGLAGFELFSLVEISKVDNNPIKAAYNHLKTFDLYNDFLDC